MNATWGGIILIGIGVALTVSALITRKALNPMRGLNPMIVSREAEPFRYWASVTMNLIPILVGWAFLAFGNSN